MRQNPSIGLPVSRRYFVQSTAAALTAASYQRVYGANEKIGVGFIGYGLIGRQHVHDFKNQPDVNMVAVSDTYQPRMYAAAEHVHNPEIRTYQDFRRLLADKDVDAVVVSTPDHWHTLISMMAMDAGKDVYAEKPLTLFVREGRWLIETALKTKRVVQVGTQQRSGLHYQRAKELIQSGYIGEMVSVQINVFRNIIPGFGNPSDQPPPAEFDYDLWLGPAPERPYNPNRAIYHFRWFWDYSGGQMTNLGQHSLDIVQWYTGVKGPKSVYSAGGRHYLQDNCEVPDRQDVMIEYPGFTAVCQYRECNGGRTVSGDGLVFHGTKGSLTIERDGFQVIGDRNVNPINMIAGMFGGHPVGGPQPVYNENEESPAEYHTQSMKDESGSADEQLANHVRNFLDCVKSRRQPISDVQSGHEVVTTCHLANISLRTGRKIEWDAEKEQIIGDREANRMLERPYRSPWDKELKHILG